MGSGNDKISDGEDLERDETGVFDMSEMTSTQLSQN